MTSSMWVVDLRDREREGESVRTFGFGDNYEEAEAYRLDLIRNGALANGFDPVIYQLPADYWDEPAPSREELEEGARRLREIVRELEQA